MKQFFLILPIIALILSACGSTTQSTPNDIPDMQGTTRSLAATIVAGTLTAQPTLTRTSTPIPPTATDTPTSLPVTTETNTPTATVTSVPFVGCFAPAGGTNLTAPFNIENNTSVAISVYINGVTREGNHPINCSYDLAKGGSLIFNIWWGDYTFYVIVTNTKTFSGSFFVNNWDKATMQVYKDKVKLGSTIYR
jgi:hypothetical protein